MRGDSSFLIDDSRSFKGSSFVFTVWNAEKTTVFLFFACIRAFCAATLVFEMQCAQIQSRRGSPFLVGVPARGTARSRSGSFGRISWRETNVRGSRGRTNVPRANKRPYSFIESYESVSRLNSASPSLVILVRLPWIWVWIRGA